MNWIVIMSRTQGEIYEYSPKSGMSLVRSFTNPLGRLKKAMMQKDRPGMSRGRYMTAAPHSLGPSKSPHEDAAEQFAREVGRTLAEDLKKDRDLQVTLVAERRMLGKLKPFFNEATLSDRVRWVAKDLAKIPQSRWPDLIGLKERPQAEEISSRFPI